MKRSSDFKIDIITKNLNSLNDLFKGLQNGVVPIIAMEGSMKDDNVDSNTDETQSVGFIDPMLSDMAEIVVKEQSCSTSLIQRKLTIGFDRASRIIDQLERIGVVKRLQNNKIDVIVKDSASLKSLLANLKYDGISENIFGITQEERSGIFAYINLGDYFIDPSCYKAWIRIDNKQHGPQSVISL